MGFFFFLLVNYTVFFSSSTMCFKVTSGHGLKVCMGDIFIKITETPIFMKKQHEIKKS